MRFGERFGAAVQEMIQSQALVDDLFLEERIHHHGADAGIFQAAHGIHFLGKRGGGGNQRVLQLQAQDRLWSDQP